MILSSIRRRRWLFGLTMLTVVLLAAVIAMLRPPVYTAIAEVVLDPAQLTRDPESALLAAQAWLRSPEAARGVARSLISLPASRPIGPAAPDGLPSGEPMLARHLPAHLSVARVPQSYALAISVSGPDARLAAASANGFAGQLVARASRADSIGNGMRVTSVADADALSAGPAAWPILAAGAVLGLVIGALVVLVAERRFSGITSGSDIRSSLDLYHLGSVPLLSSVLPDAASPIEAVTDAPRSGYAEAVRAILVAARQASAKDARVFAITSALPGEGRTTTAACLARSAALAGESVVVVDCGIRRDDAGRVFAGGRHEPDLAGLLRGDCSLDEALVHDRRNGVWFLPASDGGEDADLSGSAGLAAVLATLRARFDRVLLDTAPILTSAATRSLLPLADAAVMVIRWRATPQRVVKAARDMVPASTPWSGAILTQIDMRRQARHGRGDASVYYRESSAYYS